jgi:hypothetical protein
MKNIPALFFKSHIDTYTRKDGSVVQAHEDGRAAAQKKPKKHEVKLVEGKGYDAGGYSVNGKEYIGDEHEAIVDEAKQMAYSTGRNVEDVIRHIAPKHHFPD